MTHKFSGKKFDERLKPINYSVQILHSSDGKKYRIVDGLNGWRAIVYDWVKPENLDVIIDKLLLMSPEQRQVAPRNLDGAILVETNIAGYKKTHVMFPYEGYPYECIASKKYPNDQVYYDYPNGGGAWLTLRGDYELGKDGIYRLPYALI